jgi:hypothetical protein
MGDYSELYFANSNRKIADQQGEPGSPYLLAKYHVPLFWLALFERDDIVDVRDEATGEAWPHLVKARTAAAALFSSRQAFVQSRFPSLRSVWQQQFEQFLLRTPFEYVHVDTSQIGAMIGSASQWRADLETMLGLFSENPSATRRPSFLGKLFYKWAPSPAWELFQMRLGPAFEGANGQEPWPYCGESGTDESVPWQR